MSAKGGWRDIDAKAHNALTRFHTRAGGWEPSSLDMPFDRLMDVPLSFADFLSQAGGEQLERDRVGRIAAEWQRLQAVASALVGQPGYEAAQERADEWYHRKDEANGVDHARDITSAMEPQRAELVTESDMEQRKLGALGLFNFLQARGHTPMDFFRQFTAAGRALHRLPWAAMTMDEIAMMEGQSKAAHSWRCKVLSGEIRLAGMHGSKLPGQKSEESSESYRRVRKGNQNRKGGKKAKRKRKQRSFLGKLHGAHGTPAAA